MHGATIADSGVAQELNQAGGAPLHTEHTRPKVIVNLETSPEMACGTRLPRIRENIRIESPNVYV